MEWYQNMPSKGRKISTTRQQALYNAMVYDLQYLDQNVRDVSSYFTDGIVIGCLVNMTEDGFQILPGAVGYKGKIVPVSGTYDITVPIGHYICYTGEIVASATPTGSVIAKRTDYSNMDYSCREFNAPDIYSRLAIVNTFKDIDSVRSDFIYVKSTEGLYVRNQQSKPNMNVIFTGKKILFMSMEEMPLVSTRIYNSQKFNVQNIGGLAVVNSTKPFRLRLKLNGKAVGEAAFNSTSETHYESCSLFAPASFIDGYNRVTLSYVPEEEIEVTVKSSAILGG